VVCFAVDPVVRRADVPGLCAALAALLAARPGESVVCDVSAVAVPNAAMVEALARLALTARRAGRRLAVAGAAPDLLRLVALYGLADVLPQAGGEPEQREQPGGVEEVRDPADPAR
jgi:anti-anti-sigma regulatory factor